MSTSCQTFQLDPYRRALYACAGEPAVMRPSENLSARDGTTRGMEIVSPHFLPLTLILIWGNRRGGLRGCPLPPCHPLYLIRASRTLWVS